MEYEEQEQLYELLEHKRTYDKRLQVIGRKFREHIEQDTTGLDPFQIFEQYTAVLALYSELYEAVTQLAVWQDNLVDYVIGVCEGIMKDIDDGEE